VRPLGGFVQPGIAVKGVLERCGTRIEDQGSAR
jgi:hypothetical protein